MTGLTPIPRYLGLDVGSKRIGIAVSDELGLAAQPVLTLERRRNQREDLRSIARLCRRFVEITQHLGAREQEHAIFSSQLACAMLSGCPSSCHISSAQCGAKGDSISTSASTASRSTAMVCVRSTPPAGFVLRDGAPWTVPLLNE